MSFLTSPLLEVLMSLALAQPERLLRSKLKSRDASYIILLILKLLLAITIIAEIFRNPCLKIYNYDLSK